MRPLNLSRNSIAALYGIANPIWSETILDDVLTITLHGDSGTIPGVFKRQCQAPLIHTSGASSRRRLEESFTRAAIEYAAAKLPPVEEVVIDVPLDLVAREAAQVAHLAEAAVVNGSDESPGMEPAPPEMPRWRRKLRKAVFMQAITSERPLQPKAAMKQANHVVAFVGTNTDLESDLEEMFG